MANNDSGQSNSSTFGIFIKTLRESSKLTLRDVERASNGTVSNPYLSQLENGKIKKPSPNILHKLAEIYGSPYATLMERAGYIAPSKERKPNEKHGRAATFAIENLTSAEEKELLNYLSYFRSRGAENNES